jgi:hypothetical protein
VRYLILPIAFSLIPAAFGDTIDMGFLALVPSSTAQMDQFVIGDATGPNSSVFPDTLFPVTNPVSLSDLMLTVNFSDGTAQKFTDFDLAGDGLSFIGQDLFNLTSTPIGSAVLTGTFDTTSLTLNDGSNVTIPPDFTAILTDPSGTLREDDFTFITASATAVPEPDMTMLLFGSLFAVALVHARLRVHGLRRRLRVTQHFVRPVGLL